MKKSLMLLAGLLAVGNVAAEEAAQPVQPKMNFGVFDTSAKVPSQLKENTYSVRKSKNLQLCWAAFDMPFENSNEVTEIFTSPAESKFVERNGLVATSDDKKVHTVSTRLPKSNNDFLAKCWQFDSSDPLGSYTLKLRVNNIEFPVRTFELVK